MKRFLITWLLILQTLLITVQAENRIQQGDSSIEVLIWLLNQCVLVLQQEVSRQEKEQNQGKHK